MEWRPYIAGQVAWEYKVVDGLVDLLSDDDLDWKPATGSNWMTVGQLLYHLAGCGGESFKGVADGSFATMPPEFADAGPDAALPPAEALPALTSLAEARAKIAADQKLAEEVLAGVSDEDLASKPAPVWWDPREMTLALRLLSMIQHLNQHKGQLFYYLKLMGRDVGTAHLWGM